MGTWGPALFSDDLALEVKSAFKDKIALALSNTGVYKDWDEQGKLLRSWEYDEKGEVIEDTIKVFKELATN